jgi:hypothetical protein
MPLFKYFVTVGAFLTLGLFALSAYLTPNSPNGPARVSVAPTTASLVTVGPAPSKPK